METHTNARETGESGGWTRRHDTKWPPETKQGISRSILCLTSFSELSATPLVWRHRVWTSRGVGRNAGQRALSLIYLVLTDNEEQGRDFRIRLSVPQSSRPHSNRDTMKKMDSLLTNVKESMNMSYVTGRNEAIVNQVCAKTRCRLCCANGTQQPQWVLVPTLQEKT